VTIPLSALKISCTCGNQFLQLPFYCNKQVVERGPVEVKYVPIAENVSQTCSPVSKQVLLLVSGAEHMSGIQADAQQE